MNYRVKKAVKLIAAVTEDEALEMFGVVRKVEAAIKQMGFRTQMASREEAKKLFKETLGLYSVGLSEQATGQTEKFLELMADERVQEDELAYEFNCALSPVLHYDLFKTDS